MPRLCARCEAVLPLVEGDPAAFCVQCGLPQLRVSEAVLEQADGRGGAVVASAGAAAVSAAVGAGALDWAVLLRILLVATAVGMLPCLVLRDLLFSGAVGVAVLFLLPMLGLASGVAYLRWRPGSRMTAGLGAQMGLALGTMLALAESTVTAIASFALRYGRHNRSLQASFDAMMQQAEAQVRVSQPNLPEAAYRTLRWPEWHAGFFLFAEGALMVLLVVAGALTGLVAGVLLEARQKSLRGA